MIYNYLGISGAINVLYVPVLVQVFCTYSALSLEIQLSEAIQWETV